LNQAAGERTAMQSAERAKTRKKLDAEQRLYRAAMRHAPARAGWLREIRVALGVSVPELAGKLGINRSEIFRIEERETRKRITLETLERMAEALDCRLVYAVIPKKGTFEDLSLKRAWDIVMGEKDGLKALRRMLRSAANRGERKRGLRD
jgi:predicted DNA-binding mobile mystery protein A